MSGANTLPLGTPAIPGFVPPPVARPAPQRVFIGRIPDGVDNVFMQKLLEVRQTSVGVGRALDDG